MNEKIVINNNNLIEYRNTPWDTLAFGFMTNEIINIKYSDPDQLKELMILYEEMVSSQGIKLSYCRINAQDQYLKLNLQQSGYYYAETSILLSKTDVQKENFGKFFKKNLNFTTPQTEEDFNQIKIIASNAFHYSRFHEDPNIHQEKAKIRYFNWIDDLRLQNKEFVIYKTDKTIHSFLVFSINNQEVTLWIGGSDEGKGFLTPLFWASFFTVLQHRGIKKIGGIISAANIPMFNTYIKLSFKVEKMLIGFHRFFY